MNWSYNLEYYSSMSERRTPSRILDAALTAFTDLGFERTSVADIIARAAVSNGSFFHHFGSKEGAAAALFLSGISRYQEHVLAALLGEARASAAIRAFIAAHIAWVEAEPALALFLFERGRPDWGPDSAAAIAARNSSFVARLEDWRLAMTERHELNLLPVEVLIAQLIGPAQLVCRAWLSGKSARKPSSLRKDLERAALAALCPRSH